MATVTLANGFVPMPRDPIVNWFRAFPDGSYTWNPSTYTLTILEDYTDGDMSNGTHTINLRAPYSIQCSSKKELTIDLNGHCVYCSSYVRKRPLFLIERTSKVTIKNGIICSSSYVTKRTPLNRDCLIANYCLWAKDDVHQYFTIDNIKIISEGDYSLGIFNYGYINIKDSEMISTGYYNNLAVYNEGTLAADNTTFSSLNNASAVRVYINYSVGCCNYGKAEFTKCTFTPGSKAQSIGLFNPDGTATLNNCTINASNSSGSSSSAYGVYITGSSNNVVEINDSIFYKNGECYNLYITTGTVTINNPHFRRDGHSHSVPTIYIGGGNTTITNAENISGGNGSYDYLIYAYTGTFNIVNAKKISGGSGTYSFGINVRRATLNITTDDGSTTEITGGVGNNSYGIYGYYNTSSTAYSSYINIHNSNIIGNDGKAAVGVYIGNGTVLNTTSCNIKGNQNASASSSVVENSYGISVGSFDTAKVNISDSYIEGGYSTSSTALQIAGKGTISLTNSTIYNGHASDVCGIWANSGGTITATNCDFYNNNYANAWNNTYRGFSTVALKNCRVHAPTGGNSFTVYSQGTLTYDSDTVIDSGTYTIGGTYSAETTEETSS